MAKMTAAQAISGHKRRPRQDVGTIIARSREISSEQKAIWHNVVGAGKSRVKREFFELNEADKLALGVGLEKAVALRTGATRT